MKVRWTRDHMLGGGRVAKKGEVADVPAPEAARKIAMEFAEPAADPPAGPPEGGGRQGAASQDPKPRT